MVLVSTFHAGVIIAPSRSLTVLRKQLTGSMQMIQSLPMHLAVTQFLLIRNKHDRRQSHASGSASFAVSLGVEPIVQVVQEPS